MKIICPILAGFDIGDRDAVRAAFAGAPALQMQQAWREQAEEKFRSAFVQIGWSGDNFLIFGQLTDDLLYTSSTEDNQILCTYGDAFEIFLGDASGHGYVEFHIAPNGKRLQLFWPDGESYQKVGRKEATLSSFLVDQPIFDFSQWTEGDIWCICASVPLATFLPPETTLEGRTLRASFSRYDYSSAAEPPVLSSTSPHAVLSFHRRQEWAEVQCQHAHSNP